MENASVKKLWNDYVNSRSEILNHKVPKTTYFGDNQHDANELAKLTKKDIKKATSHSLLGLQYNKQVLPKIGDLKIVTNWEGEAQCIVKTTKVKLKPYFTIDASYAQKEGEGDKSLDYWKRVHWEYYTRELAAFERLPRESMIIVCEEFEKVF